MGLRVRDTNRQAFVDSIRNLSSVEDVTIEWGWTDTAQDYPDGTPIHLVAAVHTFGIGVPVRDILGESYDLRASELNLLTDLALNAVADGQDANSAFAIVGQKASSEMKRDFTRISFTPLSPVTVARKGHSQTLIETGHLMEQVDYAVNL